VGTDNTLVNTLGNNGRFIVPRNPHQNYGRQVLLQDDGKIVVVGMATNSTARRTMILRFNDAYTLSDSEENDLQITVFPNPFSQEIRVQCLHTITQITLFKTLGQQVIKTHNQQVMNATDLIPGIYFLSIEDAISSRATFQLIKG
jgi:hypothetical protein